MATGLHFADNAPAAEAAELDPKIAARSKDVPWYHLTPPFLSETARDVLENYSGLGKEELIPHVQRVRDSAWDLHPYPCLGGFRFLDFSINQSSHYPRVLEKLKNGGTILDLGCCLGQDLRSLAHDGVPPSQLYGADLVGDFIELGYDLFRDREKLKDATFFKGVNVFDEERLEQLRTRDGKKFDIIYLGSFLHLFDYAGQVKSVENIIKYLLSDSPDALVLGRQAGSQYPGEYAHRTNLSKKMYRHNTPTMKKLWNHFGEFDVEVEEGQWEGGIDPVFGADGSVRLKFVVKRRRTD